MSLRVIFLTGERVYLRAHVPADKECAAAWYPHPFPIDAARAEEILKERHKTLDGKRKYLVICRNATDEVVGGVQLYAGGRHAEIDVYAAPWLADAASLRADALRLLVPWLRDEVEMLTVTALIASDESESIAAAEELGMELNVRQREHLARPGGWADRLWYQALNPRWTTLEGLDA